MKILVLAESLRINETSSGIVSSTFIQGLKDENNKVTCIYENTVSVPVSWLNGVMLIPVFDKIMKRSFIDTIPKIRAINTYLKGVHIDDIEGINAWERSINAVLLNNKFDLIIALGSGSSFLPHYAMLKINTKTPWIANFHDPYPFSLYPKPYTKKRNLILRKQEKWAQKIILKANYVSFPSLYLKEWMQQFFPLLESKSLILPHLGIELVSLPNSSIDNNVTLPKGKFNILHAGTLLGPRKVDALFDAFKKFIVSDIEKKEKSLLTVIGKVDREHQDFLSNDFSNNLNIVIDRVSYKRSLDLIKQANLSLVIEAKGVKFSPFMPGKLADLIYLEKPILVLGPKKSETNRILGDNYPFTTEVDNTEKILTYLNQAWAQWKKGDLVLKDANILKKYIGSKKLNKKLQKLVLR